MINISLGIKIICHGCRNSLDAYEYDDGWHIDPCESCIGDKKK